MSTRRRRRRRRRRRLERCGCSGSTAASEIAGRCATRARTPRYRLSASAETLSRRRARPPERERESGRKGERERARERASEGARDRERLGARERVREEGR